MKALKFKKPHILINLINLVIYVHATVYNVLLSSNRNGDCSAHSSPEYA